MMGWCVIVPRHWFVSCVQLFRKRGSDPRWLDPTVCPTVDLADDEAASAFEDGHVVAIPSGIMHDYQEQRSIEGTIDQASGAVAHDLRIVTDFLHCPWKSEAPPGSHLKLRRLQLKDLGWIPDERWSRNRPFLPRSQTIWGKPRAFYSSQPRTCR